jgi:hypothetical protein
MKRYFEAAIILLLLILAASAFRGKYQTSIIGRITPAGSATVAWAVSGLDSSTSTIVNGAFNLTAKQGIYKVVIDAVEPYKDAVLENVNVKEGQTLNVGEIVLQKQ